jgi:hypothetical protein
MIVKERTRHGTSDTVGDVECMLNHASKGDSLTGYTVRRGSSVSVYAYRDGDDVVLAYGPMELMQRPADRPSRNLRFMAGHLVTGAKLNRVASLLANPPVTELVEA